ncbi:50S ribosomal protein L24 [Candidatus Woesebacteria bacterium RIFCSPHIGHO2_02_FULL_38_9]|nr:MAG: 50S ribosomal protein L24 [Candidatus Woesebacteria bacterium RIFCSPHIGHO2_02_FULL_38_9]
MLKFKIGDTVKITSGKDKGREGKIEKIFPKVGKVLVPGVNIFKKHVKKAVSRDGKGGIFEISRPLTYAAIGLICPNCKKLTRVSFRVDSLGKTRVCSKCKVAIEKNKNEK